MAMQETWLFTRTVAGDDAATEITVDFSGDIRRTPLANPAPQGLYRDGQLGAVFRDAGGVAIPYTVSLSGKKVTWTWTSAPRSAEGAQPLTVILLFAAD